MEFCQALRIGFERQGPSRIDRAGAYAARYAAKNIVAADLRNNAKFS